MDSTAAMIKLFSKDPKKLTKKDIESLKKYVLEASELKEKVDRAREITEKLEGRHQAIFKTVDGLTGYRDVLNVGDEKPRLGDVVKYAFTSDVIGGPFGLPGVTGVIKYREYAFTGYQDQYDPLTKKVTSIPIFVEVSVKDEKPEGVKTAELKKKG